MGDDRRIRPARLKTLPNGRVLVIFADDPERPRQERLGLLALLLLGLLAGVALLTVLLTRL
jgi:hypothetical protein